MNNHQLAVLLARFIFELGDEPGSTCSRIQFKAGEWPDERNQGGIGENPLVGRIESFLNDVKPEHTS